MSKNYFSVALLLAFCLQHEVARADDDDSDNDDDDGPDFPDDESTTAFDMRYDSSSNEVVFEVTSESDHYIAFGFGTSVMGTGNDMIMCSSSSGILDCLD